MDAATSWFYARQTDASKRREEEIAPGGTLVKVGRELGAAAGRDLSPDQAGAVGLAAHRTLGILYGVAATALVGRGMRPLLAGPVVGATAFVLVDEGTAITEAFEYPVESHLRGVVGHATYGMAAGLLLWITMGRGGDR